MVLALLRNMLSPEDNDVDIREYTRGSLEALEGRLGRYAVVHENTDHHHAYVVIAGKVPGFEREIERKEEKEGREKEPTHAESASSWKNQTRDLQELLGSKYDEKAVTDPREDRHAERSFRSEDGQREPIDPSIGDLVGDNMRLPAEVISSYACASQALGRQER